MKALLKFLKGKKNIIQWIITISSTFLYTKWYIKEDILLLINWLTLTIFGSASIATTKILWKTDTSGVRREV